MSTRVQKGGTIFKPVAKARSRPAADSAKSISATPDAQNSSAHPDRARGTLTPAPPSSVMPPPPVPTPRPQSQPAASQVGGPTSGLSQSSPVISNVIKPSRAGALPPSTNIEPSSSQSASVPPPVLRQLSQATLSTVISSATRNIIEFTVPVAVPRAVSPVRPMAGPASVSIDGHACSTSPPILPALHNASSDDHLLDFSAIVERGVQAGLASMSSGSNIMPMHPALPPHSQLGNLIASFQFQRTAVDENISAVAQDSPAHAADTGRPKRITRKRAADGAAKSSQDVGSSSGHTLRRRKEMVTADDFELDGEVSDTSSKRKRTSKTPRRSRAPSVPVFDTDADPGEELDPTVVTMATLCDDTGQGRISSKAAQIFNNHAAWKKTNREKRERMRILMEAKKYGRNEEEDTAHLTQPAVPGAAVAGPSTTPSRAASPSHLSEAQIQTGDAGGERTRDGFDYAESVATSRFNVQIRIGPSGETIVDEESLFVDRAEDQETENYTHIEESDTTKFVNSATYGKKFRGSRWSAEETELFFDALSQFGENYELISYVLPGRDRKSCKNKFKIEDKKNPNRIDHCLKNRTPYDMQTLSRMTGKDFSGPAPIIRARTPPNMGRLDGQAAGETQSPDAARKQSRTPGPGDEFSASAAHGNKGPSGSAATAVERPVSPELRKKQAQKKKEDVDVEVLGTIDGDWD